MIASMLILKQKDKIITRNIILNYFSIIVLKYGLMFFSISFWVFGSVLNKNLLQFFFSLGMSG